MLKVIKDYLIHQNKQLVHLFQFFSLKESVSQQIHKNVFEIANEIGRCQLWHIYQGNIGIDCFDQANTGDQK